MLLSARTRIVTIIKRRKKWWIPLLIFLLLLIWILIPKNRKPVETQAVRRGDLTQTISATGTIDAENSVNLTFQTAGKLAYVGAKKGDLVKKGQTIATLDTSTVQKNLEQALSDYAKQRNTFDQTIDDQSPKAKSDSVKRILEDNQYDLDKAVGSVELQELAKQNSVLTTPIAGVVTRADAEIPGVNVSLTTTYTVIDPDSLVFDTDIDEADIGKVRLGQAIKITLDAYPDQPIDTTVNKIDFASHATATGGTAYTVQAELPENSTYDYRQGMNGDAEIVIAESKSATIIPLASIIDDTYVYVKTPKGFEKRKVRLGLQNDVDSQVLDGVSVGDQIVLSPSDLPQEKAKEQAQNQ